jgi:serine/threonine protein kinase/Tol biopolymer transport system component
MTDIPTRLQAALSDRYRIERELGVGGMATVYLAQDLKHDRKVALKVLKPELAAVLGAERFVVEIKTTAALQHPHILPLFDSGTADGFLYYVMPFIDGETLRSKLDRETQLGIDESVKIATNVADALDYAHRHGVIHRDIKPENILLHDGRPMVADFGIALALSAAAGGRMTETGLSLGTPHYMSPEQATAEKEVTGRSDIYSLASVLYEMLTGNPPHTGASAQQIIMKIVTEEAAPVTRLRKAVPPNVAAAVAKALEKLPADRFENAKAFADALADRQFTSVPTAASFAATRTKPLGKMRIASLAIGAVLVLVAAWGWLRPGHESTFHVSIPAPAGTSFIPYPGWPALSPDGRTVVFAAMSDGASRLYRRPVDGFRAEPIEGSDDATYPFFSPDGAWVGFFTRARQLRKVALTGGQATTIVDIPFWRSGAVWRQDRTIVVISDSRGLYSVPDHGGELSPLAESDTTLAGVRLDFPQVLRDGRLLATRFKGGLGSQNRAGLVVMAPGETRWRAVPGNAWGLYVEPGFLISRPGNELVVSRFDLARGRTTGNSSQVLEGAGEARENRGISLTLNARGDVAYFAFPDAPPRFLTLVDRVGNAKRLPAPAGTFRHPRLSPDGNRLAVNRDEDLWIFDLRSSAWNRLTTNDEITEPQWSPDGRRIAHTVFDTASRYNPPAVRNADGSGDARVIRSTIGDAWTSDWSPDGRHLALYGGKVGMNVSVVDLDSAEAVHAVTRTAAVARNARFSPDGRWLAYQSNETGRMQVYVVSYPELGQKQPVSTEGGTEPAWRPRGGELYFRNGESMMAVTIRTAPTLEVGTPRELFRGPFLHDLYGDRSFDVMPDGEHFVMFEANPAAAPELRVIRNWAAELKATVAR